MIKTDRLIIRRFRANDWRDLYEYLSDPDVVLYEPYNVYNIDMCIREAAERAKDRAFWAVCLKEGGKVIGNLYLEKKDFETWELGFIFNKRYQGQGYAVESAKALMDYAFLKYETRRIIAMCNPENKHSWRLLERLGLRREGHLIRNIYFKTDDNGQPIWLDTYLFGLLFEEWKHA
jgi:[ribosomal protein S5]-alanine N-acetyltransferase